MRRALAIWLGLMMTTGTALAARPRVVVLGFSPADQALKATADSLSEQVTTELAASGAVEVANVSDLSTTLSIERQKQLLGCSPEGGSCLTELSDALGAPYVVVGTLAKLGDVVRVDLKLIRAADGVALARVGQSATLGEIFSAASALVPALLHGSGLASDPPSRAPPVVLLVAGAALAAVGAGLVIDSQLSVARLNGDLASLTFSDARQLASRTNLEAVLGPMLAGVGGLALVGGLVWLAIAGPVPPPLALVPWGDGHGFSVRGQF